ncbi:MAG: sigma-54-dependent Fis family transcriptional regulator [Bacteriovoracaceae bacterium]|nr:sigma-54-dependent Fis family transcriptional regulator [Bacteriovoracaceae bacterium]
MQEVKRYAYSAVIEKGVRLGDMAWLKPMQGRKKKIFLSRTQFHFFSSKSIPTSIFSYYLPHAGDGYLHFVLELSAETDQVNARFFMRAVGDVPFRLNGSFVFEAFIERGDRIDLGFNVLDFTQEDDLHFPEQKILPLCENILKSDLSILIEGETGTGKTTLAGEIHHLSERKGRYVHINLSSFSPALIESELFGHVKGAFTGAVCDKKGAFREADYGTLFLDEIDSLTKELQVKLLLFLDSKEVRPVGGNQSFVCHTRLIFASGSSLRERMHQGKTRRDFYYRLTAGVSIHLEKMNPEKIEKIILEFLHSQNRLITPQLLDFYKRLPWPGNLRQLYAHLKKKVVIHLDKKLQYDREDECLLELHQDVKNTTKDLTEFLPLESAKKAYALRTLQHFNGDLRIASKVLEISPHTLRTLIENTEQITH